MTTVSPLDPWLNHGGIGLMGRLCTHESLGWKQENPGGLVVQTPGAMWGGRGRAGRAPLASKMHTASGSDAHHRRARHTLRAHHGRARCAPWVGQTRTARALWASQTCTACTPDGNRVHTWLRWCRWRLRDLEF